MKTNKLILPILTGVLFAAAAHAQEDITITGSTAVRKIMYDRAATLFDPGYTTQGGALAFGNSASKITAYGTMSNAIPSLGATPVTLRFGMSGSADGLVALNNSAPLATLDPITGFSSNRVADIAFADNFPAAVAVNIPTANLTANTNVCVLPFVFFKNPTSPGMSTVKNLTKEQAIMLLSSSGTLPNGTNAMPSSFLGGTDSNPVYLFGRDIGSGTRIGVFKCVGFTGTPRQWTTNGSGSLVLAQSLAGTANVVATDITGNPGDGFASGGTLAKVVNSITTFNCIGYAGEADALTVGTNNWLTYNGVEATHANVASGKYPVWCYEHMYMRTGENTGNKGAIFNAFVAAMSDPSYQSTNTTVFTPNAVALSEMQVKRGVDGGSFTTTPVAGF